MPRKIGSSPCREGSLGVQGRGLRIKRKRGDCSPLSLSHESKRSAELRPFYREKPAAAKSRWAIPWFALRCPPSVGPTRLRNANTGSNPAESRHDAVSSVPCRNFPSVFFSRGSSSFRLSCRSRSARSDRLDYAFVTRVWFASIPPAEDLNVEISEMWKSCSKRSAGQPKW